MSTTKSLQVWIISDEANEPMGIKSFKIVDAVLAFTQAARIRAPVEILREVLYVKGPLS